MEQNKVDYILDFIIPAGPTGPQGLMGPTGPTNIKSILSYMYSNSSISGLLSIDLNNPYSIVLPSNNNTFSTTSTNITILENGYYIFTLSGTLTKTTSSGTSNLTLNVGTDELITIVQDARINDMYFSQTKMKLCSVNEVVTIVFNKDSSSDTSVQDINITITQFVL